MGGSDDLDSLLDHFPPVSHAFAYGSGVFRQRNYSDEQARGAMTDVVLAVEDPEAWHSENLVRHREHYSGLAWFGPSAIAAVQRTGAGMYFNPYARVASGRLLKYGVVSRAVLEDDLEHWSSLYVAGRMHKPVSVLREHADTAALAAANHRAALTAALLMLPAEFSEQELYLEVGSAPLLGPSSRPDPPTLRASEPLTLRASHSPTRPPSHRYPPPPVRPPTLPPVHPHTPAALRPCAPAALGPCGSGGGGSPAACCVCRWPGSATRVTCARG